MSDFTDRVPPEWLTSPPSKEVGIAAYFDQLFATKFRLYRQVYLRHQSSSRLCIDRIGIEKSGAFKGLIGFELKSGEVMSDDFTDFSKAIAQAIDYSHSRVESDLIATGNWFGKDLRYVFVFPCLYYIYELQNRGPKAVELGQRDWWAQGELKIAAKYGVGAVSYIQKRSDWGFFLGGHPAYWLKSGPTALALKHAQGEGLGSNR